AAQVVDAAGDAEGDVHGVVAIKLGARAVGHAGAGQLGAPRAGARAAVGALAPLRGRGVLSLRGRGPGAHAVATAGAAGGGRGARGHGVAWRSVRNSRRELERG